MVPAMGDPTLDPVSSLSTDVVEGQEHLGIVHESNTFEQSMAEMRIQSGRRVA